MAKGYDRMKNRRKQLARGLLVAVVAMTMFAGACRPTESPDLRGNPLSYEGRDIDSRAEHQEAVNALLEDISMLPGLEKATAIFIESEGFIAIQGKADAEYLRVRSLPKEVAMRSVELSDYIVEAYVTDDPELFKRIQNLRERIDRGEDSEQLRNDVATLQAAMRRVGITSDPDDNGDTNQPESHPPLAGEPAGPENQLQYGQPPWPR